MAQGTKKSGNYPELLGMKLMVLETDDQHQPDLGRETLVIRIDEKNEGRITEVYFA